MKTIIDVDNSNFIARCLAIHSNGFPLSERDLKRLKRLAGKRQDREPETVRAMCERALGRAEK